MLSPHTPDDLMPFGINIGHPLKLIYKYFPHYIEWLILEKNFAIDLDKFKNLPNPTPFNSPDIIIIQHTKEKEIESTIIARMIAKGLTKTDPEWLKTINSIPKKLEEYWGIDKIEKLNNNLIYALTIINKLKKKPKASKFNFSQQAIDKNNENIMKLNKKLVDFVKCFNDRPPKESYNKYNGYNGYSDDAIDSAFDGNPEATWNVD